jgi:hypothetical protein
MSPEFAVGWCDVSGASHLLSGAVDMALSSIVCPSACCVVTVFVGVLVMTFEGLHRRHYARRGKPFISTERLCV